MENHINLKLRFPIIADPAHHENFFAGAWHPYKKITVQCQTDLPASIKPVSVISENWFLISNTSPVHANEAGLIHEKPDKTGAVAFRGYILDPPIHSYSPSKEILKYWEQAYLFRHENLPYSYEYNGVFSAVCIRDAGKTLELISDAFGIGTLYYRILGDLILFATDIRYLSLYNDTPDYMAWRSLIQAGFISADRTLLISVKRAPAGHIMRFQNGKSVKYNWFDYGKLPPGTENIDNTAIAKVEDAFRTALSRCLQLNTEEFFLALSSGYDSRRILAGLIAGKIRFQAATVQIFQKNNRDLDARFSSLMAKDIGFTHRVILYENAAEYAYDDYKKRILLDAECNNSHTWAIGLMRSLPDYPIILLDGLAGDALGECGFDNIPGLHLSDEPDSILIARHTVTDAFNRILNPEKFPSVSDIRSEITDFIESLPPGMNQAELAFLLLRARRSTALCTQQMLPAGHVAVYPYMDLDYIRTALSYNPVHKFHTPFQKACLKKYWYSYYIYPGSRAIPPGMPPGNIRLSNERELAYFQQSKEVLLRNNGLPELIKLLRKTASFQLYMALQSNWIALRSTWVFKPLMDLVSHHLEKRGCWEIFSDE